ncbi:MAG: DUF4189 domain-containing protein [Thermosynechococcaceae cyanobacterium]
MRIKLSLLCGVALTSTILSFTFSNRSALAGCSGSALDPGWGDCFQQEQRQLQQQQITDEMLRLQNEQADQQSNVPAPRPAPTITGYRYTSHFALVLHPNVADVWVTWNYQSEKLAWGDAFMTCTAAMGGGCKIGLLGWNNVIATVRADDGRLWYGTGETPKEASSAALKTCSSTNQKCKVEKVFTSKNWEEPAKWDNQRHLLEGEARRGRYFPDRSVARTQSSPIGVNLPEAINPLAKHPEFQRSIQPLNEKYGFPLFASENGWWILTGKGDETGKGCVASFSPASGSPSLLLQGPTAKLSGSLQFLGANISGIDQPKEARVVLVDNDGPSAPVQALLLPFKDKSTVIVVPTDMLKTLRSTTAATWMSVQLDGKEVFHTDLTGTVLASNAMLNCMRASK